MERTSNNHQKQIKQKEVQKETRESCHFVHNMPAHLDLLYNQILLRNLKGHKSYGE